MNGTLSRTKHPHPGEILADLLETAHLSPSEFALEMDAKPEVIHDIVAQRKNVDQDTALRLERRMGVSAQFWLNAQATYDRKSL
jgi:addiction module HigA family antidote